MTLIEKRYIKKDFDFIEEKQTVKEITKQEYEQYIFEAVKFIETGAKISIIKEDNKVKSITFVSGNGLHKTVREFIRYSLWDVVDREIKISTWKY